MVRPVRDNMVIHINSDLQEMAPLQSMAIDQGVLVPMGATIFPALLSLPREICSYGNEIMPRTMDSISGIAFSSPR